MLALRAVGAFNTEEEEKEFDSLSQIYQDGKVPTGFCKATLHAAENKKPNSMSWAKCLNCLGWLMGLEPTTTGITILDSTN